jgi:hypothetical protein
MWLVLGRIATRIALEIRDGTRCPGAARAWAAGSGEPIAESRWGRCTARARPRTRVWPRARFVEGGGVRAPMGLPIETGRAIRGHA